MKKFKESSFGKIINENKGILIVLIILMILLTISTPTFFTPNNLITLTQQITNNMFIALAMTLVIITGGIDLSVGSTVAFSGTICVGLIINLGLSIPVAIAICLALGLAIGAFNGVIITKFKLPPFIVTLGTMNIVRGAAYIYTGGSSMRIRNDAFNNIGTYRIFGIIPIPIVYMVILIIIFSILLSKIKFGTYVYAIGGNREATRFSGINIEKTELIVYILSGIMAAFAGIVLAAKMYSAQPSVGQGYEMDAIAASVLGGVSMSGGVGNISGTVIGAVVIGIVSNGLNLLGISSFWQLVVMGIIILIAVIIDSQKNYISDRRKGKNAKEGEA